MVVASGLGPLPLAWSEKQTGSYNLGLWIFLLLPILSGLCVWSARKPVKPTTANC
jgi:hypothetical protein